MAFPQTALDATVELAIGADIHADPGTWSWTDVTTSIRELQKITINRGRRNRIGNFPPTRVSATADNTNGDLCRHNPFGAHYGLLKKNTPMRVSVDNGSGPVVRAAVYVPGFPPSWDPSERDQTVTLQGVGITDRLGRSKPLRSPLFRTMAGVSPDDFQPLAYWSLEDESGATQFASALPGGTAGSVTGSVSFAADDELVGSQPLPDFAASATASFPVSAYTLTNRWIVQLMVKPTATTTSLFRATTNGTGVSAVVSLNFTTNEIGLSVTDSGGGSLLSTTASIPDVRGQWVSISLSSRQNVSSQTLFDITMITNNGTSTYGTGAFAVLAAYGNVTGVSLIPSAAAAFGHVGVFVDPAFLAGGGDDVYNARAMGGWAGELAHERAERLCREERVPFTTSATESQAMGPQGTGRLLDLLRECANADQGLLFEDMNFGLTFVSATERYNLDPSITLAYDQRQILPPWDPDDDDQDYFNQVTASRPGGSEATEASETEIDDVGLFPDQINPNVETDGQLQDIAGLRLSLGLNDELTWPSVRPNLMLGGSLLDDWLATDLGQVMHITGHPSPLAPQTIEQIIEGYTETIGSFTYSVSANLSPASPWEVGVWGTARWAALWSRLAAPVDDNDTSWSVETDAGKWPWVDGSTGPQFPLYIEAGGLVYEVTAISGTSSPQTFTVTRLANDKGHDAGTAITARDSLRWVLPTS